jgi:YD repeat-containing protein
MHVFYNGDFFKPTKSLFYNKGKITGRIEYTYDTEGRRIGEEVYRKEKMSWKKSWKYENGLCIITEHRDALHRIRMSSELTILTYH